MTPEQLHSQKLSCSGNWISLGESLADLKLSVRTTNCLESEGITSTKELVALTDDDLLDIRNFGGSMLYEVKDRLAKHGLKLKTKQNYHRSPVPPGEDFLEALKKL